MKKLSLPLKRAVFAIFLLGLCASICSGEEIYHFIKEVPVDGQTGLHRLAIDPAARRLYLVSAESITAMDLGKGSVIGEVTNAPGADDFTIVPKFNRGMFRGKEAGQMSVIRLSNLKTFAKAETAPKPGTILYEPSRELLFVFSRPQRAVTVLEADDNDFVTTVALPGEPVSAVTDSRQGRTYCNLDGGKGIAVIDDKSLKVIDTWPVETGSSSCCMAVDPSRHQLYLGCHNVIVTMDDATGKVLATSSLGRDIKSVAFDPTTQFLIFTDNNGAVTIAHEDGANRFKEDQTIATDHGSDLIALDAQTHSIYQVKASNEAAGTLKVVEYKMAVSR